MERRQPKGFLWGQIYIIYCFVIGVIGLLWMWLMLKGVLPSVQETGGPASLWIIGSLSLIQWLSGIGVWVRWRIGLYLTYFVLGFLGVFSGALAFVLLVFSQIFVGKDPLFTAKIITNVIQITGSALWIGYFYRRRHWFRPLVRKK